MCCFFVSQKIYKPNGLIKGGAKKPKAQSQTYLSYAMAWKWLLYQEPIILYRIKKRFLRALEEKQPQEKEQQADA